MKAQQIIDAIHAARYTGEKRGLENTRELMDQLQIPYTPAPTIHVAGTNGKGSTCAMMESALRSGGYKTGLYTSPFLQIYHERIRINGRMISDEILEYYGNPVLEAARRLEKEKGVYPTAFELGTALAFSVFHHEKVDCAVVEVGLGGRLDPSNVVTPRVSVITALSLDHTQILGCTLEAIAAEKAGIIKPGVPVVAFKPEDDKAARVLWERARNLRAPLCWAEEEWVNIRAMDARKTRLGLTAPEVDLELELPLPGEHQAKNALLAAMALKTFGLPREAIRFGLENARWPARLEWLGNVLLDGAHNQQGARALEAFVREHLKDTRRILLTGVLDEKLDGEMLSALASLADRAVTVTPDSPRAMPAQRLAELLQQKGCQAQAAASARQGLELARAMAQEGVVICAGSLYLAGEMRTLIGLEPR